MTEISGPPDPRHPQWNVYFSVADCDAAIERARALGGRLLFPATDVPAVGRIASLADPQGASFSIMKFEAPAPE